MCSMYGPRSNAIGYLWVNLLRFSCYHTMPVCVKCINFTHRYWCRTVQCVQQWRRHHCSSLLHHSLCPYHQLVWCVAAGARCQKSWHWRHGNSTRAAGWWHANFEAILAAHNLPVSPTVSWWLVSVSVMRLSVGILKNRNKLRKHWRMRLGVT